MIFSSSSRTDPTPKLTRESGFAFLDRSARPEMERVRQFMENLARIYPADEVNELTARIRSGDDADFKSATFELVLHASLVRLGCKLQPHPRLANGASSRPDFFVTAPDGQDFFLEAVLASENNTANPSAEKRMDVALDALMQARHPNFVVAIEPQGAPSSQPSGRRLKAAALAWLNSLEPDKVATTIDAHGFDAAPTCLWTHENWHVTLRAIPIPAEMRGKEITLVATIDRGGGVVDAWTPIRDAVKFKGSKYGDLGKPFVVAINFDSFHLNRIDAMQALYGQEKYVIEVGNPARREPQFKRAPNGAWHGKSGPQYTRVSGVWIFDALNAYSVAKCQQTIYFNPWASQALPDVLTQMPHAIAKDHNMQWVDGISLRQIFDLPTEWPRDS